MGNIYKVVVTKVNMENKEEEIVLDDKYTGFTLLADCAEEDKMAEVIIHDNIASIAAKLAAGQKTSVAVRLAHILLEMHSKDIGSKEDALFRAIMGDIENE